MNKMFKGKMKVMDKKVQVAIIDIGSSKLTAIVGERGINQTFIIKGESTFKYEGFCVGEIFEEKEFRDALMSATRFLKKTMRGNLTNVYVSVPSAFTRILVKDSQISFSKKKKITDEDVDKLFDAAFVSSGSKDALINRSAIVYELDDYRRLASPVGTTSEILKGKLSFVLCDSKFIDLVSSAIKGGGATNVEFVSRTLAEAMYLVNAETRDRIAQILDVGYISTTFSIVQGDGIIFERAIDYGGGYITAALSEALNISFDDAEWLKRKINLSRLTDSSLDFVDDESGQYYNIEEIKSVIKNSLDSLCESILLAIEESGYVLPEYVKLMITGGGLALIRGAKEHISDRLSTIVEVLAPSVPMLSNPDKSSTLSLLNIALEQNA